MSREDIRNQINAYEEKIAKLEEEVSKKEISVKKEIDAEYSSKFEEALSEFRIRMKNVDKIDVKAKQFIKIRKDEKKGLKILNKKISSLSKRKVKELKEKLKLIKREKIHKVEKLRKQIRTLHKKLKVLEAKKFAERWKKWRHL